MKYRREITYDRIVDADYARGSFRGRMARRRRHWQLGVLGLAAVIAAFSMFHQKADDQPGAVAEMEPRERIGVRIPGKILQPAQDQLLARLPFEPRVPVAAPSAPKMLPDSSLHHQNWQTTEIKTGESLSIIFDRIGVSKDDAQSVISSAKSGAFCRPSTLAAHSRIASRTAGSKSLLTKSTFSIRWYSSEAATATRPNWSN